MTKREGDGLALIQIMCLLYAYNLLIPGKLGCDVTKREGGCLAIDSNIGGGVNIDRSKLS